MTTTTTTIRPTFACRQRAPWDKRPAAHTAVCAVRLRVGRWRRRRALLLSRSRPPRAEHSSCERGARRLLARRARARRQRGRRAVRVLGAGLLRERDENEAKNKKLFHIPIFDYDIRLSTGKQMNNNKKF